MARCRSATVRERPAARHAAAPKSISAVMRDHGTLTWVSIMPVIPLAGLVVVADDAFNWPPIFDSGARLGQKLALAGAMTTTRPQVPSRDRTALAIPQRTGP
jgi:hypothetical protein